MTLKIEFTDKRPKKRGLEYYSYEGYITIKDFKERFLTSIAGWGIEEYEYQWKMGIERIKTHNYSCLVTNANSLHVNPYIDMWQMYKENNIIYINNRLITLSIAKELKLNLNLSEFNASNCYDYIRLPRSKSLSTWKINIQDI